MIQGLGVRVKGLELRVWSVGFGFGAKGLRFRVYGLGFRV
jgi:hypothetical protein